METPVRAAVAPRDEDETESLSAQPSSAPAAPASVSRVRFRPSVAVGGAVASTQQRPKPLLCVGVGMGGIVRAAVSKKKRRFQDGDFDLDLTYITPRIIAMGFPSTGREGFFRNPLAEVQRFFESRHPGRYRVYNLCSERAYDPIEFAGRATRYPFDDHNPSCFDVIPAFCGDADAWLAAHPDNVIAVHCKAGKGRTGMMIAAYLVHSGFRGTAEAALRWFGMVRTANGKGVTIPSQMRYVHYYEQALRTGAPRAHTYALTHIRLRGTPLALGGSGGGGGGAGGTPVVCVPHFTLSLDGVKVFDFKKAVQARAASVHANLTGGRSSSSGASASGGGASLPPPPLGALPPGIGLDGRIRRYRRGEPYVDFDLTWTDLRVAGNVKVQFLNDKEGGSGGKPTKLCHLWFHTGFIVNSFLVFSKHVVDKANKDKKGVFPVNFAIEFYLHRVGAVPEETLMAGPQDTAAGSGVEARASNSSSSSSSSSSSGSGGVGNSSAEGPSEGLSPAASSSASKPRRTPLGPIGDAEYATESPTSSPARHRTTLSASSSKGGGSSSPGPKSSSSSFLSGLSGAFGSGRGGLLSSHPPPAEGVHSVAHGDGDDDDVTDGGRDER